MAALEALQRCSLFKDFTETGLRIFASIALEREVPAGTPLFVEATPGESLFILVKGSVRITQKAEKAERELATVGPGDHLGALALLARSTRLVSAVPAVDSLVLELTQRDFARLQAQKPQACLKLALAIAADLAARVGENRVAVQGLAAARPATSS